MAAAVEPDVDVVAIDEVQFLDDAIVGVCNDLADRGVRVSCRRCHEVPSAADEQISLVEG